MNIYESRWKRDISYCRSYIPGCSSGTMEGLEVNPGECVVGNIDM